MRSSTVLTSSSNKQVSIKLVPQPSCTIYKLGKQTKTEREEDQTSKQNQPESKEELQPIDVLNLMFKHFDKKFNNMKSQLAENSRPPLSKNLRKRLNITSNKVATKGNLIST